MLAGFSWNIVWKALGMIFNGDTWHISAYREEDEVNYEIEFSCINDQFLTQSLKKKKIFSVTFT